MSGNPIVTFHRGLVVNGWQASGFLSRRVRWRAAFSVGRTQGLACDPPGSARSVDSWARKPFRGAVAYSP